jgi:hypothetical protein
VDSGLKSSATSVSIDSVEFLAKGIRVCGGDSSKGDIALSSDSVESLARTNSGSYGGDCGFKHEAGEYPWSKDGRSVIGWGGAAGGDSPCHVLGMYTGGTALRARDAVDEERGERGRVSGKTHEPLRGFVLPCSSSPRGSLFVWFADR